MKQLLAAQKKKINTAICQAAPGIFSDGYWESTQIIWDALTIACDKNGFVWAIEGSKYDADEVSGALVQKTWNFSVTDGQQRKSYGVVVAAGAGGVIEPLSKYDICAYII